MNSQYMTISCELSFSFLKASVLHVFSERSINHMIMQDTNMIFLNYEF